MLEIASADYSSPWLRKKIVLSSMLLGYTGLILGCDSSKLLLFCGALSVPSLSMMCRFTISVILMVSMALMILMVSMALVVFVVLMISELFLSLTPKIKEIVLLSVWVQKSFLTFLKG